MSNDAKPHAVDGNFLPKNIKEIARAEASGRHHDATPAPKAAKHKPAEQDTADTPSPEEIRRANEWAKATAKAAAEVAAQVRTAEAEAHAPTKPHKLAEKTVETSSHEKALKKASEVQPKTPVHYAENDSLHEGQCAKVSVRIIPCSKGASR